MFRIMTILILLTLSGCNGCQQIQDSGSVVQNENTEKKAEKEASESDAKTENESSSQEENTESKTEMPELENKDTEKSDSREDKQNSNNDGSKPQTGKPVKKPNSKPTDSAEYDANSPGEASDKSQKFIDQASDKLKKGELIEAIKNAQIAYQLATKFPNDTACIAKAEVAKAIILKIENQSVDPSKLKNDPNLSSKTIIEVP